MPVSSGIQARFDHVDDAGELVFHAGSSAFRVTVDDKLERAILEAKQIRSEVLGAVQPHGVQTLPISRIQSLIRAGADPKTVAQQYGLSDALVRRFSSSVQTERQYAIEQFLIVPAPKESRVHTVGDLIELTLAASKVPMSSVTWNATRRGRDPWVISASFSTKQNAPQGKTDHHVRAEWTWNMPDNAVECRNAAAKVLFGETVKAETSEIPRPANQAATSVAALGRQPTNDAALPGAGEPQVVRHAERMNASAASAESAVPASRNMQQNTQTVQPVPSPVTAAGKPVSGLDATPQMQNAAMSAAQPDDPMQPTEDRHSATAQSDTESADAQQSGTEKKPNGRKRRDKRKAGRSAIPSWDEILFGD